ncbi:G5 domain-containing protein [Patescibacteria group bacterium]|nr:G5 domain-containing protein [Patescibacteria group bacterium]
MERYLGILIIIALTIFTKTFWQPPAVLGQSSAPSINSLPVNQPVRTESSFTEKLQEETELLPRKTVYQDDPETEAGEEKVLEEGEDGKKIKIYKITYYKTDKDTSGDKANTPGESKPTPGVRENEEYSRELISVETTPAKDKKILRGTKIVWRTLQTPDREIKYWKKLHVWATSYTPYCDTCSGTGRTSLGLKAGKGIVAVDPKVIKLGSKIYIPEYGMAIAGDTGGRIIGDIIDLGFDEGTANGWRARFVDIYLLD